MNKKKWIITISAVMLISSVVVLFYIFKSGSTQDYVLVEGTNAKGEKVVYRCPMHPTFTADKPGSCSICGMDLVKKKNEAQKPKTPKKILYYRNPMNPEVKSPVPMKDSMGMDYVPVYEGEDESGFTISSDKQQVIGVVKEKIQKRHLVNQILTVGEIAYDPDLYVAQEEYLQTLRTVEATKKSVLASVSKQSNSLVEAAKKKLLLLGMSNEEIDALKKKGISQENLYLPILSDTVWAYLTIYEYEIGLVKIGQGVDVDATAFPGEVFQGKVTAITPVLNAETRAIRIRAEIKDQEHKLKPKMFVNARINVDLGEKLAVPEDAVIDTGERKIVYIAKEDNIFDQREVDLGQKANGYFEVLKGLQEGDVVVTNGNFLVDSESKLKGAVK